MADKIVVEAAVRESRGKNEARRQRVAGKIPATLNGGKGRAVSLTVNAKQVGQILRSATGHNTRFKFAWAGTDQPAMWKIWRLIRSTGILFTVNLLPLRLA